MLNTILPGDVLQTLPKLPAGLFHCCVTSPPYWALRSYLKADDPQKVYEIGTEPTPEQFIATMVSVFREVRRVLRDDGVLWLNMGDTYAASGNGGGGGGKTERRDSRTIAKSRRKPVSTHQDGDQLLMPHRVAMALQADGWRLRQTTVWHKKSPMPERIADWRWMRCRVRVAKGECARMSERTGSDFVYRETQFAKWRECPGCAKCEPNGGYVLSRGKWRCTSAHEYVFLLTKGGNYFCDARAASEPATSGRPGNKGLGKYVDYVASDAMSRRQLGKANGSLSDAVEQRNPRSVWSLSNESYEGSHFATFPSELAKRCIVAGTSSAGCCAECGAPHAPIVVSERVPTRPGVNGKVTGRNSRIDQSRDPAYENEAYDAERLAQDRLEIGNRDQQRHVAINRVEGYRPTCSCGAGVVSCRVLDPFGGSGTTGQVAHHLGRDYVLCELNREYLPLIEARIREVPRCLVKPNSKRIQSAAGQTIMF